MVEKLKNKIKENQQIIDSFGPEIEKLGLEIDQQTEDAKNYYRQI
jgi:peptidoglycan hydrolase CwlO-like protein